MLTRLESFGQDIRFGGRSVTRFALANAALVLLLAVGIGASVAVLTLIERVLVAPLRAPNPESLVLLRRRAAGGETTADFPMAVVDLLRQHSQTVAALSAFDYTRVDVRFAGVTEAASGRLLSGSGFALLGATAAVGRSLGIEDDAPGRAGVAMLSFGCWQRRFGGDPGVIGTTLIVSGIPTTIVGVLSAKFTGLSVGEAPEDVWLPMSMHAALGLADHQELALLGRLSANATILSAAAELTALYRGAEQAGIIPTTSTGPTAERSRVEVVRAPQGLADLAHRLTSPLHLLLAGAALLLLVIWINAAALLLARARLRTRELAVRLAMGESRMRLVQQLLIENLFVTLTGSLLGAIAAVWAVPLLVRALVQDGTAAMIDPSPDGTVFAVLLGLALTGALVFALVQSALATRLDLATILRGSRTATSTRGAVRRGRMLVAAQLAISLVLVLDGLLVADAVRRVSATNPGFDRDHVLLFWVFPRAYGYTGSRAQVLYRSIAERLSALPNARGASLVRYRPGMPRRVTCRTDPAGIGPADVFVNIVGPGYFSTMRIPLLSGREFTWSDAKASPSVAIIARNVAEALFPGRSPVGQRLRMPGGPAGGTEVIGVAGDMTAYPMQPNEGSASTCEAYVPVAQASEADLGQINFVVRTAGDPSAITTDARAVLAAVDPQLTMIGAASGTTIVRVFYAREQGLSFMAVGFSVIAIVVAAMGLYGTLTLSVTTRLRDLGIRIALGATAARTTRGIMAEAGRILVSGSITGLIVTLASIAVMRSRVFGLDSLRLLPVIGTVIALGSATFLACYFPARRAGSVDPAIILREE